MSKGPLGIACGRPTHDEVLSWRWTHLAWGWWKSSSPRGWSSVPWLARTTHRSSCPNLRSQESNRVAPGRVEQGRCGQHERIHRGAGNTTNSGKRFLPEIITAYGCGWRVTPPPPPKPAPNIAAKSIAIGKLWTNAAVRKPLACISPNPPKEGV